MRYQSILNHTFQHFRELLDAKSIKIKYIKKFEYRMWIFVCQGHAYYISNAFQRELSVKKVVQFMK